MTEGTSYSGPPAARPAPRSVAPDEIFEGFPSTEPKAKTFLEFWGVKFMFVLLVAIVLMTLLFLAAWFLTRPSADDLATLLSLAEKSDRPAVVPHLDALEKLRQSHLEQFRDLFQILVVGGLVPLFTLIAGYVFGRSQAQRPSPEES